MYTCQKDFYENKTYYKAGDYYKGPLITEHLKAGIIGPEKAKKEEPKKIEVKEEKEEKKSKK